LPSRTTPRTERRTRAIARVDGAVPSDDAWLVEGLRAGDQDAFVELVGRYGPAMLRIARLYVPSRAVAEEVVQETWLAVLTGIGRFEGRSSLKTWLFRIHINRALSRGAKEGRSVPFSSLARHELEADDRSVDPDRFRRDGDRPGWWASPPGQWAEPPESSTLGRETISVVERAAAALPPAQRAVILLRDIAGWESDEVCDALGITPANQRVLLHRARAKIRKALEHHLASP
jgi:RNA polymerase sigma-70 factor (ECF subfamily)